MVVLTLFCACASDDMDGPAHIYKYLPKLQTCRVERAGTPRRRVDCEVGARVLRAFTTHEEGVVG